MARRSLTGNFTQQEPVAENAIDALEEKRHGRALVTDARNIHGSPVKILRQYIRNIEYNFEI